MTCLPGCGAEVEIAGIASASASADVIGLRARAATGPIGYPVITDDEGVGLVPLITRKEPRPSGTLIPVPDAGPVVRGREVVAPPRFA